VKVNVNRLNNKTGKISWGAVNAKYVAMHRPSTNVQLASYHSMYVLHTQFAFLVTIHLLYYRNCNLGARIPKSTFRFQRKKRQIQSTEYPPTLFVSISCKCTYSGLYSVSNDFGLKFWVLLYFSFYKLKCNLHPISFVTSQKFILLTTVSLVQQYRGY
jgi:hypothetical protein